MPVIKKLFLVVVVILAVTGTAALGECKVFEDQFVGMGLSQERGEVKTSETAATAKETVAAAKVKRVMYETDKFSILATD